MHSAGCFVCGENGEHKILVEKWKIECDSREQQQLNEKRGERWKEADKAH